MNGGASSIGRAGRVAELALWAGAGLIVLSVHVGAVAWLLREDAAPDMQSAPPPAIMIELAAEPEAAMTDENEISPDAETSEPQEPVEQEVPEEVEPEPPVEEPAEVKPEPEPEPVDEVVEEQVEEVVEEEPEPEVEESVLSQLENVEVPLPTPRPNPPKPRAEPKREPVKQQTTRQPQRQQPAATPKVQAQAQARQSNRTAAPQTSSRASSASVSPARWQSRLQAHLERRKRYPSGARRRREEGTAYVSFRIDDAGNVLAVSLVRSSGYPELDQAVLELVRRASPVPSPPPGVNKTITAPVQFNIR